MEFVRERIVKQYLHIKDYSLPNELKDHYNAKGPFDVLLRLNPLALYIPRRLKCRHGEPSRTVDDPPELHRTGLEELSSYLNTLDGDPVDATDFNLSQLVDYVNSALLDWEVSGILNVQGSKSARRAANRACGDCTKRR